jgi:hypothetical protein
MAHNLIEAADASRRAGDSGAFRDCPLLHPGSARFDTRATADSSSGAPDPDGAGIGGWRRLDQRGNQGHVLAA